jgi:hypothetical protein
LPISLCSLMHVYSLQVYKVVLDTCNHNTFQSKIYCLSLIRIKFNLDPLRAFCVQIYGTQNEYLPFKNKVTIRQIEFIVFYEAMC